MTDRTKVIFNPPTLHRYLLLCNLPFLLFDTPSGSRTPRIILVVSLNETQGQVHHFSSRVVGILGLMNQWDMPPKCGNSIQSINYN